MDYITCVKYVIIH